MFPLEQGAFEMLLIGAIALIVVGPKDLPILMRKVGQFTAKMRGMAAEFRSSFDEMARQSELDELRKEVEAMRSGHYTAPISAEIDKHLYDYDQHPTSYPSPAAEPDALISPCETGGGDHPQGGEGGEPQALSPASPPPPASPVPLPRSAGEDKIRKPRTKKTAVTVDAPAPPKPRAPRKPRPVVREAEG